MMRPLKQPGPWLGVVVLVLLFFAVDAKRQPQAHVGVKLYMKAMGVYRRDIHPVSSRFIRCPYNPTCSRYSVLAVQRFGIVKGLVLTVRRLWRCNGSVPLGKQDPVPVN